MQGCGDQGRLITMIPIIQDLKMLLLLRHFPHPQQNQVLLGNNTYIFCLQPRRLRDGRQHFRVISLFQNLTHKQARYS